MSLDGRSSVSAKSTRVTRAALRDGQSSRSSRSTPSVVQASGSDTAMVSNGTSVLLEAKKAELHQVVDTHDSLVRVSFTPWFCFKRPNTIFFRSGNSFICNSLLQWWRLTPRQVSYDRGVGEIVNFGTGSERGQVRSFHAGAWAVSCFLSRCTDDSFAVQSALRSDGTGSSTILEWPC